VVGDQDAATASNRKGFGSFAGTLTLMPSDGDKPRYRKYRGSRRPDENDPLAERLRNVSGPQEVPPAPQQRAPRVRPGGPIILPEPGEAPPLRRSQGVPGRPPDIPPTRRHKRRRRRPPIGRIVAIAVPILILLVALWVGYGYLRFRDAIAKANHRLDPQTRAVLKDSGGSILSTPTNVLVLGSDRRPGETSSRSDSILLIRSDPGKNQFAELSIPRDLRVPIPGHGDDKINAAYAYGGAPLAIRTIDGLLGPEAPVNHVVLVDFGGFKDLIDSLGGITIDNPEKIVSNSFDGVVWHFGKGRIHLDGRHALAYARVRENTLNPADTDVTRGLRQQRVLSALAGRLASFSTAFHLPGVGDAIGKPLTTDIQANGLLELGWRKLRSSRTLHCRLGGQIAFSGSSYLVGSELNRQVVLEWLGRSAPQAPPASDPLAPGCTVGS
jgi:LCP family protein required for cell wall assembly